jgi:hypothetical protein
MVLQVNDSKFALMKRGGCSEIHEQQVSAKKIKKYPGARHSTSFYTKYDIW